MKMLLRLLPCLLLFSGCSLFSTSDNSALDDARERWTRAAISDYAYTLTISCFCAETGMFDVEVRDGVVVETVSTTGAESFEGAGLTIDDIFGILAQAYAQQADQVIVEYDGLLGYPVSASIDYVREATDDEVFYGVDNFERLD